MHKGDHLQLQDSDADSSWQKRKRKNVTASYVICAVCGLSVRNSELGSHYNAEVSKVNLLNTKKSADSRLKKLQSKPFDKKKTRQGDDDSKEGNSKSDIFHDRSKLAERVEKYEEIRKRRWSRQAKTLLFCKQKDNDLSEELGAGSSGLLSGCVCPFCDSYVAGDEKKVTRHVEDCLQKTNGIQLENDYYSDESHEETFDEYTWAGETRVRATSFLESGLLSLEGKTVRVSTTDENEELNIDDDGGNSYGEPQYSEKDVIPCQADEPDENKARQKIRAAMVGEDMNENPAFKRTKWSEDDEDLLANGLTSSRNGEDATEEEKRSTDPTVIVKSIQANVLRLESICSAQPRCLICMEAYSDPLVSVVCWHVHCEECWLRTLGAKKLCPQCNVITSPSDLRKIFL